MKFAVVVVLLAVALGIEASGLSWGAQYAPALSYTAVSGPTVAGAWGHGAWAAPAALAAPVAWAAPAVTAWAAPAATAWAAPAATSWSARASWATPAAVDVTHGAWGHGAWAAPAAIATHAAVAPLAAASLGHEGSYVAQTRGATHIAPLAGHANSAASINLQPAPGTVH